MTNNSTLIIFSDLDGTLLDEYSYSYQAAEEAIEAIKKQSKILVFCTSKTRLEVEELQSRMGISHPFIVENGGAIYLPAQDYHLNAPYLDIINGWVRIELGFPYKQVVCHLQLIKHLTQARIEGFNEMTVEQIAAETGLNIDQAIRAKAREYDEPIKILDQGAEPLKAIQKTADDLGLELRRGGKFFHLSRGTNKGRAVRLATAMFRLRFKDVFTVGIGDSPVDLPMLRMVDLPIIVQRPDGTHNAEILEKLPVVRRIKGIGPHGWNKAISEVLSNELYRLEK